MKTFFAMMLLLCVSFSYTYAGEEYSKDEYKEPTKMEDREVIYYNHGLELELEDGMVEAEWDEFTKDGFDWYKLVYSTTNSNPVYGEDKVIFIGSIDQRETTFKLEQGSSTHYVRLCAVVLNDDYSKDRYCGKTQTLTGEYVEQYEKEEYKKEDKYVEDKKEVKQTGLSDSMKDKIEEVIGAFVEKIAAKGYTDDQMTATINVVISRLEEFKNKTGYSDIVKYMTQVLEQYRDEYSNPLEDLESIFDGL
jgi:hypothetical protein